MPRNRFFALQLVLTVVALFLSGCTAMTDLGSGMGGYNAEPTVTSTASPTTQPANPSASTIKPNASKNKVALLLPLSGRGSDAGQAMLNAAQLAMFDLGANSFELMPRDTGSTSETVRTAAQTAVQDGAGLILGPLFAGDAKTVSPVAMQSNINVVSFSTDTSVANANTFVLGFLPQSQVDSITAFSSKQGMKNIALIAPRDAYGEAVAQAFDRASRGNNFINAGILRYDGTAPAVEELQAFASSPRNIDAVLIAANAPASSQISQSLTTAGLDNNRVKRLGTGLWDQSDAARLPGLQNAFYTASDPKARAKFETKYRETYGAPPPRLASLAYDAAALAVVLARQNQGFSRQALLNSSGFSGIDGIFRFENNGLNTRGLAILQIQNNSVWVAQGAPSSF